MKCRLCGQPSVGPDKLCGDCTRALRRAREGSAALRKLPASPAIRSTATPFTPAPITLTSVPPPGWRRHVAWCAIGLVAIGVAYLVQREADRRRLPEPVVVGDRSPMPSSERTEVESASESASLETLPTTARVKAVAFPAPQATVSPKAVQGPAPSAAAQATARAKSGTKGTKASATVEPGSGPTLSTYALATDAAGKSSAGTLPETQASQQLARASVPQPAATADGPQVLAVALSKCGEEKFLAGVICEQKARLQYCAGKWGEVPECSSKPRVE